MKTRIDSNAFLYPMPVALAGSIVNGKPMFRVAPPLRGQI
jgi:hypothetical protein